MITSFVEINIYSNPSSTEYFECNLIVSEIKRKFYLETLMENRLYDKLQTILGKHEKHTSYLKFKCVNARMQFGEAMFRICKSEFSVGSINSRHNIFERVSF